MKQTAAPWKYEKAAEMRANPSPGEAALWAELKYGLHGFRFEPQFVLYGYIADFYCEAARLCVEVDGGHHLSPKRARHDEKRDRILRDCYGVKTLRVADCRCLRALPGVMEEIGAELVGTRQRLLDDFKPARRQPKPMLTPYRGYFSRPKVWR